ncbi:MAG: HAD-IIB family hydrolase [candidate division Zixibacteria bacterium]|nr:HAD-IIB family hydrolase [candidate division Zixibacteria bacterium]
MNLKNRCDIIKFLDRHYNDVYRHSMTDKRFFVSDLDGTLLRSDGTLSAYSRNNLERLLADGLQFTVASARSVQAIQPVLGDLPLQMPIIEFNGAIISDLATGHHEIINEIESSITSEILAMVQNNGFSPFISTSNDTKDLLYYCNISNEGMELYLKNRIDNKDNRLYKVKRLNESLSDRVICFTIINRKNKLIDLKSEVVERYGIHLANQFMENPYSPGWYWLTLFDSHATKDQAILKLMDRYGFSADNLTVFGDNANDIRMFKLASKAIAVENAKDELKKHATDIIGMNEDDSVVRYLIANK